jgi:hypothetical protein
MIGNSAAFVLSRKIGGLSTCAARPVRPPQSLGSLRSFLPGQADIADDKEPGENQPSAWSGLPEPPPGRGQTGLLRGHLAPIMQEKRQEKRGTEGNIRSKNIFDLRAPLRNRTVDLLLTMNPRQVRFPQVVRADQEEREPTRAITSSR